MPTFDTLFVQRAVNSPAAAECEPLQPVSYFRSFVHAGRLDGQGRVLLGSIHGIGTPGDVYRVCSAKPGEVVLNKTTRPMRRCHLARLDTRSRRRPEAAWRERRAAHRLRRSRTASRRHPGRRRTGTRCTVTAVDTIVAIAEGLNASPEDLIS